MQWHLNGLEPRGCAERRHIEVNDVVQNNAELRYEAKQLAVALACQLADWRRRG